MLTWGFGAVLIVLLAAAVWWAGARRLRLQREAEPPPPAPPPPPEPLPVLQPLFGNIEPVDGETDPDLRQADEFPPANPPYTRFEDLNWRLIIFDPAQGANASWPIRTFNDFPLRFCGSATSLLEHTRARLRPRYPVILDWDGHWFNASAQLERNPNQRSPLIDAYLGLAAGQRPVVISRRPQADAKPTGMLRCMRYGFKDYDFPLDVLQPYPADALAYLFAALTGPPQDWLWFSVARLRHDVLTANHREEELRTRLEEEITRQAAVAHENRFAVLWGLREAPAETAP